MVDRPADFMFFDQEEQTEKGYPAAQSTIRAKKGVTGLNRC